MPRPDLLALSLDDLEALTNRGLVKRAQRELDENTVTATISELPNGDITFDWSDGVNCTLHAGKGIDQATCSVPSATITRHVIRSILAYQRDLQTRGIGSATPPDGSDLSDGSVGSDGSDQASTTIWNPGDIPDATWDAHCARALVQRARKLYDAGQLVEVVCARKPTAFIHTLSVNVRFMVPGNPAYLVCDCSEPAPCAHALVAAWAFRQLAPGALSGLVTTSQLVHPPATALNDVESSLQLLIDEGFGSATKALLDRLHVQESRCREAGFAWPADLLLEILLEHNRYQKRDARFDPSRLAEHMGELMARCSAYRSNTGAVPQLFITGMPSDRPTETKSARFIGLGCDAVSGKASVEIRAFLQQEDTGAVVAATREFADPEQEPLEGLSPLHHLGTMHVLKGYSLAALGAGQLLVQGAKRSPSNRLSIGRAPSSFQAQTFAWEKLRAPLLADSFAEIASRLSVRPPACLSPRRLGASLFVCPLKAIASSGFDMITQSVVAELVDAAGTSAAMVHPYTTRGHSGAEKLLAALSDTDALPLFIAGHFRRTGTSLIVRPIGLVIQGADGRRLLQPWVDGPAEAQAPAASAESDDGQNDPLHRFHEEIVRRLGELLVSGTAAVRERDIRQWDDLAMQASELGFVRLAEPVRRLHESLRARHTGVGGTKTGTHGAITDLCILACLLTEAMD